MARTDARVTDGLAVEDGCDFASTCFSCPLVDCWETFEVPTGNSMHDAAIAATWEAGLRPEGLKERYMGKVSVLSPQVRLDIFGIHPTYEGEPPLEYAMYLVGMGLSLNDAKRITGCDYKRIRRHAIKEGIYVAA